MKALLIAVAMAWGTAAHAADITRQVAREIEHLIAHLASSGCEFNRNGRWYSSSRAVSHLERKYEYLRERDLVLTTDAFIQLAASESSRTGKPYLVRCGEAAPVPSGDWMREALARFRARASDG